MAYKCTASLVVLLAFVRSASCIRMQPSVGTAAFSNYMQHALDTDKGLFVEPQDVEAALDIEGDETRLFLSAVPIDGDAFIPLEFRQQSAVHSARPANTGGLRHSRPRPSGAKAQSHADLSAVQTGGNTNVQQDPWGSQDAGSWWKPADSTVSSPTTPQQSSGGSSQVPSWNPSGGNSGGYPQQPTYPTQQPAKPSAGGASWNPAPTQPSGGGGGGGVPNVPLSGNEGKIPAGDAGFPKALMLIQNARRTAVGLNGLAWDDSLADNMLRYLKSGPSCSGPLKHSTLATERASVGGRFKNVGENLWKGSYDPEAQLVSDDFYNELYCFNYGKVGSACTKQCSSKCQQMSVRAGCQQYHFTQYMWDTNTHVGCASHKCGNGSRLVGCQYGNANGGSGGNMMGSLPFSSNVAQALGLNGQSCS